MRTGSINHATINHATVAATFRQRSLVQAASAAGVRAASSPVVPELMTRFEGLFSHFMESKPADEPTRR